MLQTPQIAAARIQNWFKRHPAIAETDANIARLTKYIADNFSLAGECIIDDAYLDLAYQTIGGTLQHIVGPEVQVQIQQANQQAAQLAARLTAEKAEKDRAAKVLERQMRLEQEQRNRTPMSAAYGGREEAIRQQEQARRNAQEAAVRANRHAEFRRQLSDIEVFLVTDSQGRIRYGATQDQKRARKAELRRLFPEFSSEVRD